MELSCSLKNVVDPRRVGIQCDVRVCAIAISADRAEASFIARLALSEQLLVRPVAPVARAAVVTPGVGAPGVGVRAGTPMNRGGPVNRVGRR